MNVKLMRVADPVEATLLTGWCPAVLAEVAAQRSISGPDLRQSKTGMEASPRGPILTEPGRPRQTDHEYRRRGTAKQPVVYEPLRGWRRIEATERPAKVDFVCLLRQVVDDDYPQARGARCVR
jgi:hypothetical protein